jgi:hypothetical protein
MRNNRKNEEQSERISGIVSCVPVSALLVSYVHFVCEKELVTKYVRLGGKSGVSPFLV